MDADVIVIGGGAAGFFAALNIKEKSPHLRVKILEKTRQGLAKVRISGGGRCNVTHACFDRKKLADSYPRGRHELIGPFTRFSPEETIAWFQKRGVELKTESDGRMFPTTDSSETIIHCFLNEAKKLGVEVEYECAVQKVAPGFAVHLKNGQTLSCRYLVMAAGGSNPSFDLAKEIGHTIIPPVPSLFTFNCPASGLLDLSGISVNPAIVSLDGGKFSFEGPLLITHWGFSGPAVLKLSSFAARYLHEKNYSADVAINWLPDPSQKLPKNLEKRLKDLASIPEKPVLSKNEQDAWKKTLHRSIYKIEGKTTYKNEFVTAGGVDLKEINFKTMESKIVKNLFFAGEILNIDGITGGFNFQNAWTDGWIISNALKE